MSKLPRKRPRPQLGVTRLNFVPVNRNLMSLPIARGERLRPRWRLNTAKGRRYCRLTPDVLLRLPLASKLRQHPTAFDFATLYHVSALAIARGGKLSMSNTDILRHMDEPVTSRTRQKLANAIKLWENLIIVHKQWHTPKQGKSVKIIKPPIVREGDVLTITDQWWELCKGYFERVPASFVTTDYASHNLAMLLLAKRQDEPRKRVFRSMRKLTRALGINYKKRNEVLRRAVDSVERTIIDLGGYLEYELSQRGCAFQFVLGHVR